MRVVFFGTPEFAVPSLKALLTAGFDVAGVVTQPDRPRGRSRSRLVASPVKLMAEDLGIPVLQPARPVGDVFLQALRRTGAELGVVAAYGHLLRPEVLQTPPRGLLNVHASLLPRLRGAAPVPWAILNGDQHTGVSIMQMDAGLDSGPVIHQVRVPIEPGDTGGELLRRVAQAGGTALVEGIRGWLAGDLVPVPQDESQATWAPKINRETCRILWNEPAAVSARRVRAFDPEPGAWALLGDAEVKLFGATVRDGVSEQAPPGTVLRTGERLLLATGEGSLLVREVQPAGKRRMSAADWSRGRGVEAGERFA